MRRPDFDRTLTNKEFSVISLWLPTLIILAIVTSMHSMTAPVAAEPRSQCALFGTGTWYNISQTREINNYSTSNNLSYKTMDCYDLRYVK